MKNAVFLKDFDMLHSCQDIALEFNIMKCVARHLYSNTYLATLIAM